MYVTEKIFVLFWKVNLVKWHSDLYFAFLNTVIGDEGA